jgi:hypothetical protein
MGRLSKGVKPIGLYTIVFSALALLNFPSPQAGQTAAQGLPSGVLKALAADEREYCERFLGSYKKGCGETFRANLAWRELEITPGGQVAILVENKTSCGIAGCALYLFVQQKSGNFTQVLGAEGGLGTLKRVAVLKKITNGHYDIRVTWSDGKTSSVYQWDGWHYSTDDRDFWGTGSKMSG